MADCNRTSLISSRVTPLLNAALTCIRNSSPRFKATIIASVSRLRVWRGRPGRAHISPQALRVMKSWKSRLKSVVAATARSTCSSPRTERRIFMPCWKRLVSSIGVIEYPPVSSGQEAAHRLGECVGLLDIRKVSGGEFNLHSSTDSLSKEMGVGGGCDRVLPAIDDERWGLDLRNRFSLIHIADCGTRGGITLWRRVLQHLLCPGDLFRGRCPKLRRKPALDDSGSHRLHAVLAYSRDARVPRVFCANASRSVAEYQTMQSVDRNTLVYAK